MLNLISGLLSLKGIYTLILAITIHYEWNGKVITRLIGVRRLFSSHTGAYIAKILQETLGRFKATIDSVFAICTDNGANMVRAATITKLFQSHLLDDFLLNNLPFHDREQAYSLFIDKELKKRAHIIGDKSGKYAFGIHCAAHTMELAVKDALKNSIESALIESAREMIKKTAK